MARLCRFPFPVASCSLHGNNFDFLRLLLSLLVLRCHAGLVGFQLPGTGDGYFLGGRWAVEVFFVISGYLIFKSWESKPNWSSYVEKRARRILPAYWCVVLLCGLAMSLESTLSFQEYFGHPELSKYLVSHIVFMGFFQNTLPGVFTENVQQYVNGPLWTIKIEVMFYACVPLIAMLAHRIPRASLFAVVYLCSLIWEVGFETASVQYDRQGLATLAHQLPGQMAFFIAGGALHYYHDAFIRHSQKLFLASVLLLIWHFSRGLIWLYPAALAVATVYIALRMPYFGNFGRFGDFSYGLYIYHFPILQVLAT
jgi:peptidoglycan/LPS O-acetylase OafA/YrhL